MHSTLYRTEEHLTEISHWKFQCKYLHILEELAGWVTQLKGLILAAHTNTVQSVRIWAIISPEAEQEEKRESRTDCSLKKQKAADLVSINLCYFKGASFI